MIVEEFPQLGHHQRIDSGMFSAFAFSQASLAAVDLQAIKSFGLIEVEIISGDFGFEAEKRFDFLYFGDRVFDESIAAHD